MDYVRRFFQDFLRTAEGDLNIFGKILSILLVFLVVRILIGIFNRIIDRTMASKGLHFENQGRSTTLGGIIKKSLKYVLLFIAIVISLELIGISTGSILATAGIGGLAISFGAQSLVKDIITGFFIIMEEQYNVGDHIKVLDYEGFVEEVGIRVTKIRGFAGDLYIVPNGSIQDVSNMTRGAMRAWVDVSISYDEDVDKALDLLNKTCEEVRNNNENIVDGPSVLGVTELADYYVRISIVAKTVPGFQWATEREIRKRAKEKLKEANITIPYPKQVIYRGGEYGS